MILGVFKRYYFLFLFLSLFPNIVNAQYFICGDIYLNGRVDVLDAFSAAQVGVFNYDLTQINGLNALSSSLSNDQLIESCLNGDPNGDTDITIIDALIIGQLAVGLNPITYCIDDVTFCSLPYRMPCFDMYGLTQNDIDNFCGFSPPPPPGSGGSGSNKNSGKENEEEESGSSKSSGKGSGSADDDD